MHTKLINQTNCDNYIKIRRFSGICETATPGAYSLKEKCRFNLEISRKLGVCRVDICITNDDDGSKFVLPVEYADTKLGIDYYEISLNLEEMCNGKKDGLLYYCFRFESYPDYIYTSSVNNVDFTLVRGEKEAKSFRLLVYDNNYKTPNWAKDAIMYHVFVDRFRKTEHNLPVREDCKVNNDWYTGIPEYAPYPGAHLDNNEFFGGSLYGVAEKLDYLLELGVNCIYLSPIFKAYSNHKYDTGDYMKIDEMFGGENAFKNLLEEVAKRGIHIILDGVFNHTGNDSRYFNAYGKYDDDGAVQKYDSKYRDWYYFNEYPNDYECWWGIKILPKLNNNNPETVEFFLGENGVVRKYIADGTSGWRLDVADEVPHEFLTKLRSAAKAQNPDALIIGEVWENAADKIAYSKRRKYFSGYQLDSVMNYPVKNAIVSFMKTGDCSEFYDTITELYASYPSESSGVLMNILGTHDTERILTLLGCDSSDLGVSNHEKAHFALEEYRKEHAVKLLKIASTIQFTLPGMPCIFYGDEAGMEGMGDPFCRRPYPWGNENSDLIEHYKALGKLKRSCQALKNTSIKFVEHSGGVCVYKRGNDKNAVYVCVNMTDLPVACKFAEGKNVLFGDIDNSNGDLLLLPKSAIVVDA